MIVPFVEFKAVGKILTCIAVQIYFEFVHSLRVRQGWAEN